LTHLIVRLEEWKNMKTTWVAIASSLGTAMLLGLALASPKQQETTRNRNVAVKLEWVRLSPKVSESLTVSVDEGKQASVSRPVSGGQGTRQVVITPTLDGGMCTLTLHITSNNGSTQTLDTRVTMPLGETKVISAASTKSKGETSEEMIFVTPQAE
jgi:hypothetical protein